MTPGQEFVIKTIIGAVMLSALSSATYLVAIAVLWLSPKNYAVSAAIAAAFFLAGFIYVAWWMNRQVGQWWNS
jgi:hypothetical protein